MPFSVDSVVGNQPPIRESIWLMEPVEDNPYANRLMTVEIAPILLRASIRSDSIIAMERSRRDEAETQSAFSPKRKCPASFNVAASE